VRLATAARVLAADQIFLNLNTHATIPDVGLRPSPSQYRSARSRPYRHI
jgi:hypothetical protein